MMHIWSILILLYLEYLKKLYKLDHIYKSPIYATGNPYINSNKKCDVRVLELLGIVC